jgi:hypothetical protein
MTHGGMTPVRGDSNDQVPAFEGASLGALPKKKRGGRRAPPPPRCDYFCCRLKFTVTVRMKPVGSPLSSSGW